MTPEELQKRDLSIAGTWKLLEIAEATNAPAEMPNDDVIPIEVWCGDSIFNSVDGWRVVIFYDCGSLDYISHFISPDGVAIDFWEWPNESTNTDAQLLKSWRGIGDLDKLRSQYYKAHLTAVLVQRQVRALEITEQ